MNSHDEIIYGRMEPREAAVSAVQSSARPEAIVVTLPDGARREFPGPVTGAEMAAAIGPGLAKAAIAVKIDGQPRDLATLIDHDAAVAIITRETPEGLEILRHDAAHVMAEAVKELYPETQVTFGPATETGFYYDFARAAPFTPEDLAKIEERMREIVRPRREDHPRGLGPRRGGRVFRRHRRALQGRIHRRDPGGRGDQPLPPGRFRRSVHRPASAVDRPSRPGVQADERGRRLLARRRQERAAAARLRHRLGRARKSSTSISSGSRKPSAATTAGSGASSTCSICGRRRSAASSGTPRAGRCSASSRDYMRRPARRRRLSRGQGPAAARPQPVGSHRPLGEFPREHVHRRKPRRAGARGQADELPGPRADLPQPAAGATANCRCAWPNSAAATATSRRARCTASCGCARFTQDDAHIFCTEDQVTAEAIAFCRLLLSIYRDFGFEDVAIKFADRPGAAHRQRRGLGPRREGPASDAVEAAGLAYTLNPGEGAFYGPKLEFRAARRARPRLAMRHLAARFHRCRSGSARPMSARMAGATPRSCCIARSSARWSGSSAS